VAVKEIVYIQFLQREKKSSKAVLLSLTNLFKKTIKTCLLIEINLR